MGARSAPEDVQVIGDDRALHSEDEDHDRQAQRDLGHGDRDGERGEDHSHHVGVEARESDQVDVDGIEHQLDAEQDPDGVPSRYDAEETDGKERRGEGQVRAEPHGYSSGLAKYSAPRSPTSSSTARSSNGRTNSVSSTWPRARVTSTAIIGRSTGRSAPRRKRRTPRSRAPASTRPVTMCRLVCVMRSPTRRSVTTMAKTTRVMTPPAYSRSCTAARNSASSARNTPAVAVSDSAR